MKTAIVTGATSLLGTAVLDVLLQQNIEVFAVVRPQSPHLNRLPQHHHLHSIELELTDISQLGKMNLPPCDVFYHLAWDGTRAASREDAVRQERNVQASIDAVQTAVALGCEAFIGAGSQAEYGLLAGKVDESYPPNPSTAYGKAKLKAYQDGQQYAKEHQLRFVWPRIFSLYGINDDESTLVMTCLKKMRQGLSIDMTACTHMWEFLHAADAARAYFLLENADNASGVYHVASCESRPLKEFVQEMAQITDSKSALNFGAIPYPPQGVVSFEPIADRLRQETGWSPQVTFRQGIETILQHME